MLVKTLILCVLFRMLRNNRISCIHNNSFTGLYNVRLLSLYDNQLTTITPGAFDTLQTLSTLYVPNPCTRGFLWLNLTDLSFYRAVCSCIFQNCSD